jgi:hypothetical protein
LQQQRSTFQHEGIEVYAISPDPIDVPQRFADRFGIRNTHIPADHAWFGIPFPGMYMVDDTGHVFVKHFVVDLAPDGQMVGQTTANAEGLTVRTWSSAPAIRRAQMTVVTVEIRLAEGLHFYGQPLPECYIPVELDIDAGDGLLVQQIVYPEAQTHRFEAIDETLPAYSRTFRIKAHCMGQAREGRVDIYASLKYQACDEAVCYLPEHLTFDMNLDMLGHDFERV